MFRKMRRFQQQLTEEDCKKVLREEWRGILSVHGENGYPYGVPMDFLYEEDAGKIYFHCAKEGHKLDAIKANDKVSFCVFDKGYHQDGDWALTFHSVIIFGRIQLLPEGEFAAEKLRLLGLKCYPSVESVDEAMQSATNRAQILELSIDHMTGKRINEK